MSGEEGYTDTGSEPYIGTWPTPEYRIATFNLENLDKNVEDPPWDKRLRILRPMIERIDADLLFLQEVSNLESLEELLENTKYSDYYLHHTKKKDSEEPFKRRNLVTLSRLPIENCEQYYHKHVDAPMWRSATAYPEQHEAREYSWERPILHCHVILPNGRILHAINLHLKSKTPSDINGQKHGFTWKSHQGWAEGFFISMLKRVGQALETRVLLEKLMKDDPYNTLIAIGGDFNADIGSLPFQTIVGSVLETDNPDLQCSVMIPCEFNVPAEQRYTLFHRGKECMIDHVIVSQALFAYWTETEIFNEVLPDESLAYKGDRLFPESDHAPVVARFRKDPKWFGETS
ncbi:MAG: endonuclease/exonuclease/phosphatase family protein [Candidatus Hodarchaeota archaeon]